MFIKRHWRQALIQRNAIAARMRDGDESFVLFAEGTSTNGLAVKPFKTSLLSVASLGAGPAGRRAGRDARLQPARRRTPVSLANCDLYAWYADMPFMPHLWEVLRQPGIEIEVEFQEPVLSWSVPSRKPLGKALRAAIAGRLVALRGAATLASSSDLVATGEVPRTAIQH
jgi:1-acyl-sn-glycerol-3-phosphate acyltransferase